MSVERWKPTIRHMGSGPVAEMTIPADPVEGRYVLWSDYQAAEARAVDEKKRAGHNADLWRFEKARADAAEEESQSNRCSCGKWMHQHNNVWEPPGPKCRPLAWKEVAEREARVAGERRAEGRKAHLRAERAEQQLADLLSACKQWRQATESRCRLIDSRGEAAKTMLPADRALCEAIDRVGS